MAQRLGRLLVTRDTYGAALIAQNGPPVAPTFLTDLGTGLPLPINYTAQPNNQGVPRVLVAGAAAAQSSGYSLTSRTCATITIAGEAPTFQLTPPRPVDGSMPPGHAQ